MSRVIVTLEFDVIMYPRSYGYLRLAILWSFLPS